MKSLNFLPLAAVFMLIFLLNSCEKHEKHDTQKKETTTTTTTHQEHR